MGAPLTTWARPAWAANSAVDGQLVVHLLQVPCSAVRQPDYITEAVRTVDVIVEVTDHVRVDADGVAVDRGDVHVNVDELRLRVADAHALVASLTAALDALHT